MPYLFVLIHLVNQFDDNYFDNNDEVKFVYVYVCVCMCVCVYIYIYIWFGDSFDNYDCLLITWNDELYLLS